LIPDGANQIKSGRTRMIMRLGDQSSNSSAAPRPRSTLRLE